MSDAPALDVRSDICWSDATSVTVLGRDLCTDIIGELDFGSFAFLLLTERMPSAAESTLFNAALVSLVEHGITPNAMATRLTHLGAPESLQSAVAAGLLGLGSRFVGTIEGAARFVTEGAARLTAAGDDSDAAVRAEAERIVAGFRERGEHVPGIGHPIHKPVDPRAERLFEIAEAEGFPTLPIRLMRAVAAAGSEASGRALPVNVTGAIGTVVALLGLDWRIARGLGVISRTVGLVGHLREELARPMATTLWRTTDAAATRHLHPQG
ncbi:MAG TPA: citryl-CoA lyase [Pseudonocardia sp.]|uniref:citryl-CoA lyase n=1 Tax=Pseudonocardia sp. TaxID=60912 RepID=UPI002B4AC46A|nr:citryl-CoA lyase [Pseudonocardia sp.]HLU54633.1 citryl-CoA lyase [Pseudonocardia sp.]